MAAHEKLEYASEEAELQRQMTILSAKKEAAVADAELSALYEELDDNIQKVPVPEEDSQNRVALIIIRRVF